MVTRHIWNDINHHAASKAHDSWIFIIYHVRPYVYVCTICECVIVALDDENKKYKMTYNLTLWNFDETNEKPLQHTLNEIKIYNWNNSMLR